MGAKITRCGDRRRGRRGKSGLVRGNRRKMSRGARADRFFQTSVVRGRNVDVSIERFRISGAPKLAALLRWEFSAPGNYEIIETGTGRVEGGGKPRRDSVVYPLHRRASRITSCGDLGPGVSASVLPRAVRARLMPAGNFASAAGGRGRWREVGAGKLGGAKFLPDIRGTTLRDIHPARHRAEASFNCRAAGRV